MDYRDRLQTAAMASLLATFADHRLYDSGGAGGVYMHATDSLVIEQEHKEMNERGGVEGWIYSTEITVSVTRRRMN